MSRIEARIETKIEAYNIGVAGSGMSTTLRRLDEQNFQIEAYNIGVAGSGMSTMLGKFSDVYEKVDVGTIMDDAETKFIDQHLLDKFMVVGACQEEVGKQDTFVK